MKSFDVLRLVQRGRQVQEYRSSVVAANPRKANREGRRGLGACLVALVRPAASSEAWRASYRDPAQGWTDIGDVTVDFTDVPVVRVLMGLPQWAREALTADWPRPSETAPEYAAEKAAFREAEAQVYAAETQVEREAALKRALEASARTMEASERAIARIQGQEKAG